MDNVITALADGLWETTFANHFKEYRWKTPCTKCFGKQKGEVGSAFFKFGLPVDLWT